jgi:FlaA1/EpsC-like NDP-sugar epimerase
MRDSEGAVYRFFDFIYSRPRVFPLLSDSATWLVGFAVAAVLQRSRMDAALYSSIGVLALLGIIFQASAGFVAGIYRYRWRFSSFEEVSALGGTWMLATTMLLLTSGVIEGSTTGDFPVSAVGMGAIFAMAGMLFQRVVWRRWWELQRRPDSEGRKRTVVFGAGEGGAQVLRAMMADPRSAYFPVALIDDNPMLRNRQIEGVRVEGTREDLTSVAKAHNADVLLIAIAYANSALINEAAAMAAASGLEFRVLPSTSELVDKLTVADVRPPTVEDLLGRDPVEIDLESVADYIRGKRVLITGAGGSIGSELSRQVGQFEPASIFLLDRDESALHGLQLSMQGRALLDSEELIVADIRDRNRVFEIFRRHRPEVVFHAAALKHLTLLENHPEEGIKTNVFGTKNLLDAAMEVRVARFVNVSTDKAADPTSVLGATKLAAERLTARAAKVTGEPYLSVRFGNVLGSRGSVLPTFLDQIEKGNTVTVTHPEVTRYFMTIPEAVRLVVQAGAIGDPGEVLVLDMGEPVKIVDLAQQLIDLLKPGTRIEFTGLRPGEKLHEALIARSEVGTARIHPRITHTAAEWSEPADALETMGAETVDQVRQQLGNEVSSAASVSLD